MDMYQKRKMRKIEKNEENMGKASINWDISTYSKITSNLDK